MTTQPTFTGESWEDPALINTTKGLMAPSDLQKTETRHEDDNETAFAVEYRLGGELVHRSAATFLKQGMFADGVQAVFS